MTNWGPERIAKSNGLSDQYFGCEELGKLDWKLERWDSEVTDGCTLSFFPRCKMKLIDVVVRDEECEIDIHILKREVTSDDVLSPEWVEVCQLHERWAMSFFTVRVHHLLEESSEVDRHFSLDREQAPMPLSLLSADFKKLFLSPTLSDITIVIGDEEIPAHKLILATRLPYFESLIASGH